MKRGRQKPAAQQWVTTVIRKGWQARERVRRRSTQQRLAHVLPVNDLREHEVDAICWCAPEQRQIRGWRGQVVGTIVVHNAMDGRELIERHGIQ